MKKPPGLLIGCHVGMALICGFAIVFRGLARFMRVTFESFVPQAIAWEAKNAWDKCGGAIAGTVSWPAGPGRACAAMYMCANEAPLSAPQYDLLVSAIRRLPDCGDP